MTLIRIGTCASCGCRFEQAAAARPAQFCGHPWCELRRLEQKQWGRFLTRCKHCLGVIVYDDARQRWSHTHEGNGHAATVAAQPPFRTSTPRRGTHG